MAFLCMDTKTVGRTAVGSSSAILYEGLLSTLLSKFAILSFAITALSAPDIARATAEGPDYFAVRGLKSDIVLTIRAKPSARSRNVGDIPHDGRRIKNLGCQGGPSLAEWTEMTDEERESAARNRWCRIVYQGIEGWVAGRFLAEDG